MAGLNIKTTLAKRQLKSKGEVRKEMHERIKLLWLDCVRAFIREAIKHVHVETGMSEASFYDLATNVRLGNAVLADIMGKGSHGAKLTYTDIKGKSHPGKKKSITLGKELGGRKKAYDIKFGSPNNPMLRFEFNIVVYQYKLHEFGYQDAAWNSLEQGRLAFLEAWRTGYKQHMSAKSILAFLMPKGSVTKR